MLSRLNSWTKLLILVALAYLAACSRSSRTEAALGPDAAQARDATSASTVGSGASAANDGSVDVVASASPGWSDAPAKDVITGGTVDGAALRAKNRARLSRDHASVMLIRGDDVRALGTRICEAKVPQRPKDTKILIKPNMGGFEWFRDPKTNGGDDGLVGRITQPEFVRGIVQCLKARGHTRITIAEGWGATHKDWEHLIRASGYEAMAKEEGVPLVAMDDDGVFDVEGDKPGKPLAVTGMEKTHMPKVLLPKILAEHLDGGLFISAPKLKVHRFGVVSIGIKGMQGVVMTSDASPAFHQKWRSHRELGAALEAGKRDEPDARQKYVASLEVFAERMTDMLELASPDVVLAEGAPAMGGDGFGKRFPVPEHVALGGTNPILVDRIGAQFLGLWDNAALGRELLGHNTSPLIEIAAKRFGVDISAPLVEGDGASLLAKPRPAHLLGMAGFEIKDGATAGSDLEAGDAGVALPELVAARATTSLVIDGNANEDAWRAATPITFDTNTRGDHTAIATTVRALWAPRTGTSGGALTFAIDMDGAGFFVDESRPKDVERERLYEEDCAEIFLGPDPTRRTHYFEMEVGPLGHFFDIEIDRAAKDAGSVTKKSDTSWSGNLEIASRPERAAHRAHLEIAIRAPEITAALAPNARLALGLFRVEGRVSSAPRAYLAWSPARTERPNFHVPEAFGTLRLQP